MKNHKSNKINDTQIAKKGQKPVENGSFENSQKNSLKNNQPKKYFLPYQVEWLNDQSQVKVWDKSRRIGATYVQAYEDVLDCIQKKVPAIWFSSADESAAKEYILYCAQWAKLFDIGARDLGEAALESEKAVKTFQILFTNGARITALSSNPKQFRSKGGKVVLDEFAHHEDSRALWKAAKPAIMWGYPIRILSTHNGKSCLFYKFIESIKQGKLKWSLHQTDIYKAAYDGLVEKIKGRPVTDKEIEAWIEEQRKDAFDEFTWLEEYCCQPVDEKSAFLSYEEIVACETEIEPFDLRQIDPNANLYLGVDIGRRKDLTVIWLLDTNHKFHHTLNVRVIEKTPFRVQMEIISSYLAHPATRRCCIDASGLGMQLAEQLKEKFGSKVEPITFTGPVKEELAYNLRMNFENKTVAIPADHDIREDLHSVRKVTTASNNIRFDVNAESEVSGHADRFWALALALYAAKSSGEIFVASGRRRESYKILEGY